MQIAAKEIVNQFEQKGILKPSTSPSSSPILLVKKPNGSLRIVSDFREVNLITIKDAHPLPLIPASYDKVSRGNYITLIDLKDGYYQIPLHKDFIS